MKQSRVLREFAGAGSARIVGMVSTLALSVVVADAVGVESFGRYVTLLALVNVTGVIATLGLGRFALLRVPKTEDPSIKAQIVARGGVAASLAAVGSGAVLAALLFRTSIDERLVVLGLVVLLTVSHYLSSALRSVAQDAVANATNGALGGPAAQVLTLVGVLSLAGSGTTLTVAGVLLVHACALAATDLVQLVALRRAVSLRFAGFPSTEDYRSSLPFSFIQGVALLPVDLIVGSAVLTPTQLGVYAVARRLANVAGMPLQVANVATVRRISKLLAIDRDRAQELVRSTARLALGLSAIPLAIVLFGGSVVVDLLFGDAFADAATPLVVLTLGLWVSVLTGPCGTVLTMAGRALGVAVVGGVAAAAIAVFGSALGSQWDEVGIAVAVAAVTSMRFLALAFWTIRDVGISTFAIGGRRHAASVPQISQEHP